MWPYVKTAMPAEVSGCSMWDLGCTTRWSYSDHVLLPSPLLFEETERSSLSLEVTSTTENIINFFGICNWFNEEDVKRLAFVSIARPGIGNGFLSLLSGIYCQAPGWVLNLLDPGVRNLNDVKTNFVVTRICHRCFQCRVEAQYQQPTNSVAREQQ